MPEPGPRDPLLRFRAEFEILERCTYLVSHSLGAMPKGAADGLSRYAREWNERGVRAWNEGWWELPVTLGDRLGTLLGAPPGSVTLQPNVTLASAVFLSALGFDRSRPRLVTTELDFPSLLYLYEGLAARGAEVVRVPSDDGIGVETERLLEAIDERTEVVALSHVAFRSSFVHDVGRIVARARESGARVLLDLYQSAGSVPLDLAALDVDAAVGGCLKWLCGGPGTAFLYVSPAVRGELAPRITGWMAHRDPFEFGLELDPAEGPQRFLHGTPSIPAHRAAEAGMDLVGQAGIGAIRAKSLHQTGRILSRCREEGWEVRTPKAEERRGGTVSILPPHAYAVSRELLARDILVDYRPGGGIRLAPHFYNTDDEIEHALHEIRAILDRGTWKKHESGDRDLVT